VGLRLRWPAAKAIQWAAALTALKMQRPGPFSGTLKDVEQKVTALKQTDNN
jgi:sugar/nucleoside kinase (ribokinase family)